MRRLEKRVVKIEERRAHLENHTINSNHIHSDKQ